MSLSPWSFAERRFLKAISWIGTLFPAIEESAKEALKASYKRGLQDAQTLHAQECKGGYRRGFTEGYNAGQQDAVGSLLWRLLRVPIRFG